jgi:hypothetical protein
MPRRPARPLADGNWPEGMCQMSGALYRIGGACFARGWLVVVIWLVLLAAAGAGMKIGGGQLDNAFTIPGSQSQAALDQVKTDFHAIIAGGAAARVVVAAALIMTAIFASFLLSGDTTIKSLALALATGVACDALLVRMTIVPAVLALTGNHAWHLPRWLNRILPHLDIEGATPHQQPRHRAAEKTCQQ